jgi:iron complex outermembrane receptor protein
VTVSATRIDKRVEDLPMRVEVLGANEIEEKQLMTPGDIVMMLNEMGGMRVQATSPALGAVTIRVQGMRGRYTRFLADGLPLFGEEVGGLGLLQIPPSDLGQVEVIKGVASALYGAGALGGVVNLISRRPGTRPTRDVLINRTSRGGTDAVLFAAQPLTGFWSASVLAGGHWQDKDDVDSDGWADLAHYSRAVLRPRVFWNDHAGRSFYATAGMTREARTGGTMAGAVLPATQSEFVESLDTGRYDGGVVFQAPIEQSVLTMKVSATTNRQEHLLDQSLERIRQNTVFLEVAVRRGAGRHTWVAGGAFERSTLDPREWPEFAFKYNVPGLFLQDDLDVARWLSVSASARFDWHYKLGSHFSPRVSTLVRGANWNSRLSVGSGFFAPSPLTDATEAAGLSRLILVKPVKAELGRSVSLDVTRMIGPVSLTATGFHYHVSDPLVLNRDLYILRNLSEPTVTQGLEGIATYRRSPLSVTATYTYVRSHEGVGATRDDIPLTPRHSAGFVGMWEQSDQGRVGFEAYFTGRQRLEDNPYRAWSRPYTLLGLLAEKRFGRVRLFVNAENLTDMRQTNWDPMTRSFRSIDGRWTVDAWAPLDGRVVNGGLRVQF